MCIDVEEADSGHFRFENLRSLRTRNLTECIVKKKSDRRGVGEVLTAQRSLWISRSTERRSGCSFSFSIYGENSRKRMDGGREREKEIIVLIPATKLEELRITVRTSKLDC